MSTAAAIITELFDGIDPAAVTALREVAARKGISDEQLADLARYIALSPQQQARHMEQLYAIVACSESLLVRRSMLVELAQGYLLPLDLVFSDYDRWCRAGGQPAA